MSNIIQSYKNSLQYNIQMYVCDEYLPYQITKIACEQEKYNQFTIKDLNIETGCILEEGNSLSFCIACDDGHGRKLQGRITFFSDELAGKNMDAEIIKILEHMIQ